MPIGFIVATIARQSFSPNEFDVIYVVGVREKTVSEQLRS